MSIQSVIEAIETARINNKNLGNSIEGKLNNLIGQIEDMKIGVVKEIAEQDRDLVVVMEGKV
jgi:hypothetical protein